jgi:hypothetical protein
MKRNISGLLLLVFGLRATLAAFLLFVALAHSAPPEPQHWRDLLAAPVDDEWQQIFGAPFQHHARPAETMAEKFQAVQAIIARSNKRGLTIPVFLPPSLAVMRREAIPATSPGARTAVALSRVPARELFHYLAALLHYEVVETEHGLLLQPRQFE